VLGKELNLKISMAIALCFSLLIGSDLEREFSIAGNNRSEIERAIREVPDHQYLGMEWLITHMPKEDLKTLSSDFLLSNCQLAYESQENSPWNESIPQDIFFDSILPYASLNERRDDWRADFQSRFSSVIKEAETPYEAAAILNNQIYEMVGVIYSTDRPKADQSPYESIDAGMASCTGLSILLIDACRSVGIPARFVGTPLWYNDSGNHSWVEIWDNGWHYTGAAEPTDDRLNEGWFSGLAENALPGNMKYGIFANTWNNSDIYFPMDWLPGDKTYRAVDVTERYTVNVKSNKLVPIRIKVCDLSGKRKTSIVKVVGEDNFSFEGVTKNEEYDANDHLTVMLPKGKTFQIKSENDVQTIDVEKEEIINLISVKSSR
jgi:hypothetical protein|tara:strand:+ start:3516 stop:4646 length:1131 start_codon:yes stop_codon:yes gene_type:complete